VTSSLEIEKALMSLPASARIKASMST